jgi:hypothetical protein
MVLDANQFISQLSKLHIEENFSSCVTSAFPVIASGGVKGEESSSLGNSYYLQ